jgi:hypothetical protein
MKSLNKVFTDGNLVDVSIRMWTGERMLQPEDLGLSDSHISDAFKLGKKALIPREVTTGLKRLDQQARACLNKHSFPFAFGGSRFVPKKTFIKFAEEFEGIKQKYEERVQSLLDNYENYKLEMRTHYVAAAKEAHARMTSIRNIETDENVFVNDFLARVDSFYPPKEKLESKFSIDYMVFQVALPDLTQASYDDLIEEDEKIQMLQMAKQMELQDRIKTFVEDTVSGMREKASKVLGHFESSIKGYKKITKASINAVLNMIDSYIDLDIIGDDEFIAQMVSFKQDHLVHLTDVVLKQRPEHAKFICDELKRLVTMAEDHAAISALSDAYKNKIDL